VPKLITISVLILLATVSCGFSDLDVEFGLGVGRGEPVRDAISRLGWPIQIAHAEGQTIYYWRASLGGDVCKIWGSAWHGFIVNWGYQSCAF